MPPYDAAPHRVFLKHLYMGVTEKQLMDELEKADASKGLYFVKLNKQGLFDAKRSINCFLSYETAEQVQDAIQKLHGHMLSGLAKFPLEADVAYPRRNGGYFSRQDEWHADLKDENGWHIRSLRINQ